MLALALTVVSLLLTRKNVTQPVGDLTADTASYGTPVPLHDGTTEVVAQMDWLKNGKKDVRIKKKKILFGLGGSITTNTYFATFGVTIGEGVRALRRVWMNDDLVIDYSAEPLEASIDSAGILVAGGKYDWIRFEFQAGTTDQRPTFTEMWALGGELGTQSAKEIGESGFENVTAYRGTCRLVFDNLPLKEFGDQIPTVKVETVDANGSVYRVEVVGEDANPVFFSAYNHITDGLGYAYVIGGGGRITKIDIRTGTIIWARELEDETDENGEAVQIGDADDNPYLYSTTLSAVIIPASASRTAAFYLIDTVTGDLRVGANKSGIQPDNGDFGSVSLIRSQRYLDVYTYAETGTTVETTDLDALTVNFANVTRARAAGGVIYWRNSVQAKQYIASYAGYGWEIDVTALQVGTTANLAYSNAAQGVVIGLERGPLIRITDDTTGAYQAVAAGQSVPTTTLSSRGSTLGHLYLESTFAHIATYQPGFAYFPVGVNNPATGFIKVNLAAFAVSQYIPRTDIYDYAAGDIVLPQGGPTYDQSTNALVHSGGNRLTIYYLDRAFQQTTTLQTLMERWAVPANIPSGYLDATEATQIIDGYVLYDNAKTALATLSDVVGADIYEEEGQIKARPRDGYAAVQAIDADHLGAGVGKDTGRDRERSIANERLIPKRIELSCKDVDADHETNVAVAQRHADAVETRSIAKIDSKAHLTADRANTAAWRLLDQAWRERDRIEFDLPFSLYPLLSPADTVTFPDGDDLINVKLERIAGAHARRYEGVISDPTGFTAIVSGNSATLPEQGFTPIARSVPIPIDAHLTHDDATAQGGYIFGIAAEQNLTWPGATRFQSNDQGTLYTLIGVEDTAMTDYFTDAALGDVANPHLVDRGNSFTITSAATYTDATLAALYANPLLNLVLIGARDGEWELVQFANATDNADGTWTFSTLLRGMRGSEHLTGDHRSGDRVIFYDEETFDRYGSASDYGVELYLAALSLNQPEETLVERQFTHNARGLRAYAPAYFEHEIAAGSPQDITFNWMARVRTGGSDLDDETPALTDENNYRIRIYSGATLKRTLTVTGAQSTTYTAANYATDFPGGGTVTAKVSQQNTTTGYGVESTISFTGP